MSEREKKLIIFFGIALFIVVNFFGYKLFLDQKQKSAGDLRKAQNQLNEARNYQEKYGTVSEEMDWVESHLPKPKAGQTVQTELERFMDNQAASNQLTVKRRRILPLVEGVNFNRAKVEFVVNGMEEGLYRWLDRLQTPEQLRAVTHLQLSPQRDDDTKIDCTVVVDQWYVPSVSGGSGETTPAPDSADDTPAPEAADKPTAGNPPGTNGQ
ncbi:MAG: hypothetical protein JWO82_2796 [Akkermansiaceae bacterium]|nr:hypothetical protein [Akkermansiaceae bacterium]